LLARFAELRQDIEQAMSRGLFSTLDAEFLTAAVVGVAFEMAEAMQRRATMDAEAAAQFATALFMAWHHRASGAYCRRKLKAWGEA
jgi:hypothetical protein